jgi:hypothetical protein
MNCDHLNCKKYTYKQTSSSCLQHLTCSICMEFLVSPYEICELKCKHIFHSNCIQTWKITSDTCPQCRVNIQCENHTIHSRNVMTEIILQQVKMISDIKKENTRMSDELFVCHMEQNDMSLQLASMKLLILLHY